ncbi:DMT family transporter [Flexibacterium corallicola]|uniref:DMT family transporter n=1 Tax=Flexibacterium corallicola TaxID=3037259 RepID=UPI00286EF1D1|nr:DMT family transporter [Pseudovibrio sp. M1P-2-3]
MFILPSLAAISASMGWAVGFILAQTPARRIGAFEFTRIQLLVCAAISAFICTFLGYWQSLDWSYYPSFFLSTGIGIILGNLLMIECLRLGGARRADLLMTLKAPIVSILAYYWLGEVLSIIDIIGGVIILSGIAIAILNESKDQSEAVRGPIALVILLGLLAASCQGLSFLLLKPALLSGSEPLAITAVRLTGAALILSLIGLWPAHPIAPQAKLDKPLLFQTAIPGILGYIVSSSFLLYAISNTHTGLATILGSLSPVIVLPIMAFKNRKLPSFSGLAGATLSVLGAGIIIIF